MTKCQNARRVVARFACLEARAARRGKSRVFCPLGNAGWQGEGGGRFLFAGCPGGLCAGSAGGCQPEGGAECRNVTRILGAGKPRLEGKRPPKPRFPPLSTRRKISLRQEICVFAARRKFLSAKKFDFVRMKTAGKREKCSYEAFLRPRF